LFWRQLLKKRSTIFAFQEFNLEQFGIVEIDSNGKTVSIEEKPRKPRSNIAV